MLSKQHYMAFVSKLIRSKQWTRKQCFSVKSQLKMASRKWKQQSVNIDNILAGSDWLDIGPFRVLPWTISGLESCVVIKAKQLNIAFDMGYACRDAVKCQNVFISHGHIDHVASVVSHAARRALYSMTPATYYVPSKLVEPLQTIAAGFASMHENEAAIRDIHLNPVDIGDEVHLAGGYMVTPFPTHHRVPSQGYLVYRQHRKLKPQFANMSSKEIAALIQAGTLVHDMTNIPEIAYTGDTTFQLFQSPSNPDLLRVNLLITETTYVDHSIDNKGVTSVQKGRIRGHIHLQQIADNATLFDKVEHLLLVHFSDKYSVDYIKKCVNETLPEKLLRKTNLGTFLKDKYR